MDSIKSNMDEVEKTLFKRAEENLYENDKYINLPDNHKDQLWDDAITEMKRSLNLLHKKMGALDTKITDYSYMANHFHEATSKAEEMYKRDIEMRRKYYQEHDHVKAKDGPKVNLQEIDDIFDEYENVEKRSSLGILATLPNLCLICVILASGYLWWTLQNLNKFRLD